jgi:hypothetical protein
MISQQSDVEVVAYAPSFRDAWDGFIPRAKNGNFLFFRNYMDYHRDRFQDHSLLFFIDGALCACLPANRVGDALHSHQGLTFGGLVMKSEIRLDHAFAMIAALRTYMKANAIGQIVYRAMPHPYHQLPAEEDLLALHRFGATPIDVRATSMLRAGTNNPFSRNRNRDLKRFGEAGLAVKQSCDFRRFMRLCTDNLGKRHSARPVHTESEMAMLAARFSEHIQLYTVERESEFLGGVVIYRNRACTRSQYLAQSAAGQKLGVLAAIYDHLLSTVLAPGDWFDLGSSIDPTTTSLNEGVHLYKESLGARAVQQVTYRMGVD